MGSFTISERTQVYERVLAIAKADSRVTGGAVVGSFASNNEDELSDIDITFGIKSGIEVAQVLQEWTELLNADFNIIDFFDIKFSTSIYRVFLFHNCLELDLSVVPENDYGAITPNFRLLFGKANKPKIPSKPDVEHLIGLGWHHVLHANSAICRSKPWQAEYWISALRDHIISMKCIRLGLPSVYAKGADSISNQEIRGMESTFIKSLDLSELTVTLIAITQFLISEIQHHDEKLANKLATTFQKLFDKG
jgi:predicted nucleotidyltransferase